MKQKLAITFCIILYAVIVPFLEINVTHVFNPDWTPHVRIHEVWQLITNSSIGVLCLWLIWIKKEIIISAVISLIITGSFLTAFILQDFYDGSMKYINGTEKTLLGVNIGVIGFGLAFILLVITTFLQLKKLKTEK